MGMNVFWNLVTPKRRSISSEGFPDRISLVFLLEQSLLFDYSAEYLYRESSIST